MLYQQTSYNTGLCMEFRFLARVARTASSDILPAVSIRVCVSVCLYVRPCVCYTDKFCKTAEPCVGPTKHVYTRMQWHNYKFAPPLCKGCETWSQAPLPAYHEILLHASNDDAQREKNWGLAQGPPDPCGPPCFAGLGLQVRLLRHCRDGSTSTCGRHLTNIIES